MVNAQLLSETMDAVIAADQDGTWNQATWYDPIRDDQGNFCGTAGCFAGHRAFLDGYKLVWRDNWHRLPGYYEIENTVQDCILNFASIPSYVQNRLELTDHQAEVLFSENNTLDELKEMVNALLAGDDLSTWEINDVEQVVVSGPPFWIDEVTIFNAGVRASAGTHNGGDIN